MATLKSINTILTVAAQFLDQAATEMRESELKLVNENTEHIGRALAEIFIIQDRIYKLEPELKPKYLKEVPECPEADGLLTRFMGEAIGMEQSGNIGGAIEKLKEFLLLESTPHHKKVARGEIERLSGD